MSSEFCLAFVITLLGKRELAFFQFVVSELAVIVCLLFFVLSLVDYYL